MARSMSERVLNDITLRMLMPEDDVGYANQWLEDLILEWDVSSPPGKSTCSRRHKAAMIIKRIPVACRTEIRR